MILTTSDISSLAGSLFWWEVAEYTFAGLVTLACAGEYIAEFTDWLTGCEKEKKTRLSKRSTLLLVFALAFELICLVKTNSLYGRLVGSLAEKAGHADSLAQSATQNAVIALSKSQEATGKADTANSKADSASDKAAGLFIKLTKAEAEVGQLEFMVSARGILDNNALIEGLNPLKGTFVVLRSYSYDLDGYDLCKSILSAANKAGMKPLDQCGRVPETTPPMAGIQVLAPDWDTETKLSNAIAWRGKVWGGVSGGVGKPETPLMIFVGVKNPFSIGPQLAPAPEPKSNKAKRKTAEKLR